MDVSIPPCCNQCNTSTTNSTTPEEAAAPSNARTKLNTASDMISVGRRFSTGNSSCSVSTDPLSTSMSSSCVYDGAVGCGLGIIDSGTSTHSSRSATSSNAEASKGETILNERFRKYGIVPLKNHIHTHTHSSSNSSNSNLSNNNSSLTSRKNRSFITSLSSSSSVPPAMSADVEEQPSTSCHHDSSRSCSSSSITGNNFNSFNNSDLSPSLSNTAPRPPPSPAAATADMSDLPEEQNHPHHRQLPQDERAYTDEHGEASIVDGASDGGGDDGDVQQQLLPPPPVSSIESTPQHILSAVEEIHRWLFVEGGHIGDVETLMVEYASFVRDRFSVPLDRLYYGE